jgi:hypothetical protein
VPQLDVIARALNRTRASSSDSDPTSDEVRAFLQRRLAGFALLGVGLFGLFAVWRAVTVFIEIQVQGKPSDWGSVVGVTTQVLLFAGMWLLCRRRTLSLRALHVIDVAGTMMACGSMLLMSYLPDGPGERGIDDYAVIRPDYIMLLALSNILVGRSIYVPSTARRTLVLGLSIGLLLLVSLFVLHVRLHQPSDYSATAHPELRDDPTTWAIRWTIIGAVWWTAAVVMATMASRVFYGLRAEVRDARKLGQYTLVEVLGEGGMGVVYRANHALLRRATAVKLLPPDKLGEESLARFEREVQLTALLSHPNTIRIFDYGRTSDGVFYYAMELLDGAGLDRVVRASGPLPAGRVIHIMEQIAGALAEAHDVGLIHRDIKPANLILTEQGGVPDLVKVLDFGLVKRVAGSSEASRPPAISLGDRMAGTPQYMSPEAITAPASVDARTDLYALGAVGYYLLAGVEVFKGGNAVEICSHHLHTDPLPPSRRVDRSAATPVPADLEALILACLAKSPGARPRSARALRAALRRCADAGSWTDDHARAWWAEHGPTLRAAPRDRRPPSPATALAIDLTQRQAPTVKHPPPAG